MKRKTVVFAMMTIISLSVACSSKKESEIQQDTKPQETETTKDDIVADDSEKQQSGNESETTDSSNEDSGETDSREESIEQQSASGQQTTTSQQQTTTKQQQTSTKQQQTTTKQQQTTTSQQQTTTKQQQTTTGQQQTTPPDVQESTIGGGMADSGSVILDIKPSSKADAMATSIVSTIITSNMNAYDRVKAIHDYLVKNVNYDYYGLQNGSLADYVYTAEGALCNRLAVCQGYAEAFELMCAKAGIQANMVYGDAGNDAEGWQSHAWNVVRIDGQWYQIDCTWDDPLVNSAVVTDGSNLTYVYFLLTDSEMYADHKVNTQYSPDVQKCTSTLFKEYAQRLSLQTALGSNGTIVSTAEEFKEKIKSLTASGVYTINIAAPSTVTDTNMIGEAVRSGFENAQMSVAYSISMSCRVVCGYDVYGISVVLQ